VRFSVRLTPRGGLDRIDGVRNGTLAVRVAAPPVDGAANVALLRLIAANLDVPASAVALLGPSTGRVKRIEVRGIDATALRARWPDLAL
jgi:uncharacterized protein YggU (UPF0235/DUF167 family)